MNSSIIRVLALSVSLVGCASVPTLSGAPEDIANQVGANAVAYNQAYGRAIGDQVLLNVLRARDRLPLYHLSMSGISNSSELATTAGLTFNEFSMDGDGAGHGEITGSRTLTTKPAYELNPFSHDSDHPGGLPFETVQPEFFQHYWDNQWPRDILLLIMVDSMRFQSRGQARQSFINSASSYRSDCSPPATGHIPSAGCAYLGELDTIARDQSAQVAFTCQTHAHQPRHCDTRITLGSGPHIGRVYHVTLRALDDMIYFVGGLMRVTPQDGVISSIAKVRPTGLYDDDTLPAGARPVVARTAPLFRVAEAPTRRRLHGDYAAEVSYRGQRYVAGPAISSNCVNGSACAPEHDGDRSAQVLSLLTQLVVLTQSNEAQTAPERVLTR